MAAKPATPAKPALLVPLGVYQSGNRSTAIVVKSRDNCVWFISMHTGRIEVHTAGPERFVRDWPISLPDYPVLRALRKYRDCELGRDDQSQKVMDRLLEKAEA